MPVHDWTKVEAGIFHAFHVAWVSHLQGALNAGLLPSGYYALAEQHAGGAIADLLTLHATPARRGSQPPPEASGGIAVAEAPPMVRRTETAEPAAVARRRTLSIRHVSGHRLVALLEIVSPANKDRAESVEAFAAKVVSAIDLGVHVMIVDFFPPSSHDPQGMHGVIRQRLDLSADLYEVPLDEPLTLASYAAGPLIQMYLEHLRIGGVIPEMPLFLSPDRYVKLPLQPTYDAAYHDMPAFWRNVLEGRTPEV